MRLSLSKVAFIACVAATAFTATSANAVQLRTYGCDTGFFEGCAGFVEVPQQQAGRRVVRLTHDTSPIYMKQTDPRYNSAMRDAGGGGGGGGGG
ncbi:hypothetical protein, partial [Bradyrhizobium diazoefficiens]